MKLATLQQGGRDGTLVVVSRDLSRCRAVPAIARTLLAAMDDWATVEPQLRQVYEALNSGAIEGEPFDQAACHSPLPRTWQWADGSAYINHVELVRKALEAPLYWIASNAGLDGSVVVAKVAEAPAGHGFNAASLQYGDLVADGVIDPVKVTRSAVENAASVGRMVLTTEGAVVDKPEEDDEAAGGHQH